MGSKGQPLVLRANKGMKVRGSEGQPGGSEDHPGQFEGQPRESEG